MRFPRFRKLISFEAMIIGMSFIGAGLFWLLIHKNHPTGLWQLYEYVLIGQAYSLTLGLLFGALIQCLIKLKAKEINNPWFTFLIFKAGILVGAFAGSKIGANAATITGFTGITAKQMGQTVVNFGVSETVDALYSSVAAIVFGVTLGQITNVIYGTVLGIAVILINRKIFI